MVAKRKLEVGDPSVAECGLSTTVFVFSFYPFSMTTLQYFYFFKVWIVRSHKAEVYIENLHEALSTEVDSYPGIMPFRKGR